jgi:hypothetical protein
MLDRPTWSRTDPVIAPDDRSMAVLQYLVATIALAASVVLALSR